MKYSFTSLSSLFAFVDQMPKERAEPLTLQGAEGHKLTVTVTNKHSLTLLVLFSNLYQMVKSPRTEMRFSEPTGFGVQSKYPKSVFTRLDVGGFFH